MTKNQRPFTRGTPPADVEINVELVSRLLADQHPDLASLPLREIDSGWDNAMFRLGDQLAVRLPRRAIAASLIEHEQTWLPRLVGKLTLPVPAPVRVGQPGIGYPWRWSVVRWISGRTADLQTPRASEAGAFAAFLRSLHQPAPCDAPANPVRGVPLGERASGVEARMKRMAEASELITPEIQRTWQEALHAPIDIPPTWIHGDLHPRNVLVESGVIAGVIDWGDMAAGDCAVDLASIWMLFDNSRRVDEAIDVYGGLSNATRRRARGWAVLFGAMLFETGLVDHPQHAAIGERTLRRIAEWG